MYKLPQAENPHDMQRWRSDKVNQSLYQKLMRNKNAEQKGKVRFTEKLLPQQERQMYINVQNSTSSHRLKEESLDRNILELPTNNLLTDGGETSESFYNN